MKKSKFLLSFLLSVAMLLGGTLLCLAVPTIQTLPATNVGMTDGTKATINGDVIIANEKLEATTGVAGFSTLIYGDRWVSQTFLTTDDYAISHVRLHIDRDGDVSGLTFTVGIRATTNGIPSGVDLVTGSKGATDISTSAAWHQISFSENYTLLGNTTYAIVARLSGGSLGNGINWSITSQNYTNGAARQSTNAGVNWNVPSDDMLFETYGYRSTEVWFEWGYDTGYGNVVGNANTYEGGVSTYNLTGFEPGRVVYYRFVGEDIGGVVYGDSQTFTATGSIPYNIANAVLPIAGVAVLIVFIIFAIASGVTLLTILTVGLIIIVGSAFLPAIIQGLASMW